MDAPSALSLHRLPPFYRRALPALWLVLPGLLVLTIVVGDGLSAALFSPRLWLPVLVMALPAAYLWQEGVDVCPTGLRRRIQFRRFLPYSEMSAWVYDARPGVRVLRVFDSAQQIVLECRAAQMADFERLIEALQTYLPDAGQVITAPPEPAAAPPR
ncbi:MAG: hypothetical protein U0452_03220 [Anaerolineae bacterium]